MAQNDAVQELQRAQDALAKGDGIAAEAALRIAMERGASRETIAASMGEAKMLQGNLAQARRWLAPGRFVWSQKTYGFRMLGRLEMKEGNLQAAARAFNRALGANPESAALWVDIGQLRYRAGEQIQAIAAVRQAVIYDPTNVTALSFQGQIVRDANGPAAALPWFARAHIHAPENVEILGHYAAALGELGRAKDMLAVTRRMIALDPRNPQAFYLQATMAARAGNIELARRLMLRAGEPLREVPSAMLLTGVLEYRAGNYATAIDVLDRLSQRQPDNHTASLLLARVLYQAGQMRELTGRFGTDASREDASPYLLTLVARAYEALGDRGNAARLLDRAADTAGSVFLHPAPGSIPASVLERRWLADPARAEGGIALVRQQLAEGSQPAAVSTARALVSRYPGAADMRVLLGDTLAISGAHAAALDEYNLASQVRYPRFLLARRVAVSMRSGNSDAGGRMVNGYLQQNPMDGRTAIWAANFAAGQDRYAQAGPLYQRAAVLGAIDGAPDNLANLALAKLHSGDVPAARVDILKAYRMQPSSRGLTLAAAKVLSDVDGEGGNPARALLAKTVRMSGSN